MGDAGIEHPPVTASKKQIPEKCHSNGTESGTPKDEIDPNLAWLVEVWPGLPEEVKTAVRRLIETHKTEHK